MSSGEGEASFVTVVSGLPRTGTSMMMQMLAAAGLPTFTDGARLPDRSNPRGYFEHEAVKRLAQESDFVTEAKGKAIKVVAPLLPKLPSGLHYRILLMERDLDEVLRSQASMLGDNDPRPEVERERENRILRAAFTKSLGQARAWIDEQPEATALEFDHGEVVREPMEAARRVAAFLDRPTDPIALARMAEAVDASLYRAR